PRRLPQFEHLRAAATGLRTEFVALLDDDDVWLANHLERAISWFDLSHVNGITVSSRAVFSTDVAAAQCAPVTPPHEGSEREWLERALRSWFGSTSGIVLRREVLERHVWVRTGLVDCHLQISAVIGGYRAKGFEYPSYL